MEVAAGKRFLGGLCACVQCREIAMASSQLPRRIVKVRSYENGVKVAVKNANKRQSFQLESSVNRHNAFCDGSLIRSSHALTLFYE